MQFVASLHRSDCFRLERQLAGGIRTRWDTAPFHGARETRVTVHKYLIVIVGYRTQKVGNPIRYRDPCICPRNLCIRECIDSIILNLKERITAY